MIVNYHKREFKPDGLYYKFGIHTILFIDYTELKDYEINTFNWVLNGITQDRIDKKEVL